MPRLGADLQVFEVRVLPLDVASTFPRLSIHRAAGGDINKTLD